MDPRPTWFGVVSGGQQVVLWSTLFQAVCKPSFTADPFQASSEFGGLLLGDLDLQVGAFIH